MAANWTRDGLIKLSGRSLLLGYFLSSLCCLGTTLPMSQFAPVSGTSAIISLQPYHLGVSRGRIKDHYHQPVPRRQHVVDFETLSPKQGAAGTSLSSFYPMNNLEEHLPKLKRFDDIEAFSEERGYNADVINSNPFFWLNTEGTYWSLPGNAMNVETGVTNKKRGMCAGIVDNLALRRCRCLQVFASSALCSNYKR